MKRSLSGMFVISFLLVMLLLATVIFGSYSLVVHQSGQQAMINARDALNDTAGNLGK